MHASGRTSGYCHQKSTLPRSQEPQQRRYSVFRLFPGNSRPLQWNSTLCRLHLNLSQVVTTLRTCENHRLFSSVIHKSNLRKAPVWRTCSPTGTRSCMVPIPDLGAPPQDATWWETRLPQCSLQKWELNLARLEQIRKLERGNKVVKVIYDQNVIINKLN